MAENNPIDLQLIVLEGGLPAQLPRSLVKAMNDPPATVFSLLLIWVLERGWRRQRPVWEPRKPALICPHCRPSWRGAVEETVRGLAGNAPGRGAGWTRWATPLPSSPLMPHQPQHPAPGSSGVSSVLKRDQSNIQTQRQPRRLRLGVQAEEREDQCVQGRGRAAGRQG